ncbi:hypothetical protein Tco_0262751, partial [Tanacetum coccineum]
MTTSVGNNSVFRSFFEKQKLTGPNFIDWFRQLRLVLSTEDKELSHVSHRVDEKEEAILRELALQLKPGALSLYVGDGHRAAVEAIGTYH